MKILGEAGEWVVVVGGGTFLVCGAAHPDAEPAQPCVHPGGGFGARAACDAPVSGVGQWTCRDLPSLAFCLDPRASVFSRKTCWSSALGSSLSSSDRSSGRFGWAVLPLDPADPEPPLPVIMSVMPYLRCPTP